MDIKCQIHNRINFRFCRRKRQQRKSNEKKSHEMFGIRHWQIFTKFQQTRTRRMKRQKKSLAQTQSRTLQTTTSTRRKRPYKNKKSANRMSAHTENAETCIIIWFFYYYNSRHHINDAPLYHFVAPDVHLHSKIEFFLCVYYLWREKDRRQSRRYRYVNTITHSIIILDSSVRVYLV